MRSVLLIAVCLLTVVSVGSAAAEDGAISEATLSVLGLEGMQVVSDTEGMQVRGMSSNAFAFGSSLVFGQLVDTQNPGNFLVLSDINGGRGSDENAGLSVASLATQGPQGSSIAGILDIQSGNPAIQVFLGQIIANAGNASNIGAAGLSAATGN